MLLSNPLRVVIIDDQPIIRKDATLLVNKLNRFTVVGSYSSVQESLRGIPDSHPDLLLLDINLGDGTAFDVLEQLPHKTNKVIFLTAYREHALRAIKFGVIDYILKPINELELHQALNKVLHLPSANDDTKAIVNQEIYDNSQRLVLSSKQRTQIVAVNEIMYCKSDSGYTTFYLFNERQIMTSKCIKEYEDFLSENKFIRTHQSFVVNPNYVTTYDNDGFLILRNGVEIPVATRRKEIVIHALTRNQ